MEEWEKQDLLDAMSFVAFKEASNRLNEEGKEVLRMLDEATTTWEIPAPEAFGEAAGVDDLPKRDQIDSFRQVEGE